MSSENSVHLVGNLTRDPELRFSQNGSPRCTLGIAVNKRWLNKQTNDWEERTSFFNVIVWGPMAENVAATMSKGMRVVVNGELEQRSWDTDDGEKRTVVEVVASEVAPSMRFATADVQREERNDQRNGGGRRQNSSQPRNDNWSGPDEEPF